MRTITINKNANFWFQASRRLQKEGKSAEAIMAMEQVVNNLEGALYHLFEKFPGTKEELKQIEDKYAQTTLQS